MPRICWTPSQGPGVGDKYTAPPPLRRYADELAADPGRLRVALTTRAWSGVAVDPEVAAVAVAVGHVLEQQGHLIIDASPAVDWDGVMLSTRLATVAAAAPMLGAPAPA